MKLMLKFMVFILIAVPSVFLATEKNCRQMLVCRSEAPIRPMVLVYHKDLLITKIGRMDRAEQQLCYTPSQSRHISAPVNFLGYPLLPIICRGKNLVHLLGISKIPQKQKCSSKSLSSFSTPVVMDQQPAPIVVVQNQFEGVVRSTILAYIRQQELAKRAR